MPFAAGRWPMQPGWGRLAVCLVEAGRNAASRLPVHDPVWHTVCMTQQARVDRPAVVAASASSSTASPHRKMAGGKPARGRLSREAIVEAGLALLETQSLEEFSLARLAARLGAGVMSLYTYFPSRDALMLALADEIFARFEVPAVQPRWQDTVRAWLWATVAHLDRHPVALKLKRWEGHVSPAWLRTWFPMVTLLKRQGLDGRELAFAMSWFTTSAMGFIKAQLASPAMRQQGTLHFIDQLDEPDQRLAADLWFDLKSLDRDATLAFGFDTLVLGLEDLLERTQTTR